MNIETESKILEKLEKIEQRLEKLEDIQAEINKDINQIKTSQAVLTNDSSWLKVLFGGGISIIIVLLGVVINTVFRLLAIAL